MSTQWAMHGPDIRGITYHFGTTVTSGSGTCVTLCKPWRSGKWRTQKCACGRMRVSKHGAPGPLLTNRLPPKLPPSA